MLKRSQIFLAITSLFLLACFSFGQTAAELKRASELFRQGTEKYNKGQYDAAIADYNEYIKIRPNAASVWFNRGIAYMAKAEAAMNRSDFEKAAEDLTQAIKLDPKDKDVFINRGNVYSRLMVIDFNRYLRLAIDDYTQAIKLDPRSAAAYSGRSRVYEDSNQLDKAFADVNTSIRLNPNDAVPYYTRAKIYTFRNNYKAARTDLEKALQIYPGYPQAKIQLNYVNEEARKQAAGTSAVKTAPITPSLVKTEIVDLSDGYKRADDAAKALDHRKVIDIVSRTLPLISMQSEGLPANGLDEFVYLDLLRKRAKAYLSLKLYKEAQDEYTRVVSHSIKNMNRHNDKANVEMRNDRGSGGGAIMATVQTASSIIICKSTFTAVSEWVDTLNDERSIDMSMKFTSAIYMSAIREACAASYYMDGTFEEAKAYGYFGSDIKTRQLNIAIDRYTTAIQYLQVFREAYVARAKSYRGLGRIDLAVADEQKANSLPIKK